MCLHESHIVMEMWPKKSLLSEITAFFGAHNSLLMLMQGNETSATSCDCQATYLIDCIQQQHTQEQKRTIAHCTRRANMVPTVTLQD